MNYELCRINFSKWTFLFITEEIKLNTVIVEGGYMSGIPEKSMFDGDDRRWSEIFKSRQKCSIGFKSGLWQGHSRTFISLLFGHSSVALSLCFGSLSWCNVNILLSLRFMDDLSRISSRILLHFAPSIVPSILTSLPVCADENSPLTWCCYHHAWQ